MLFHALELLRGRALEVLVTDAEMHRCPVGEFLAGAGEHFLKQRFRLVELVLLQGAKSGFVILQGLGDAGIVRDSRFLGVSLLSHVKNFSCAGWNKDSLALEFGEPLIKYHPKSGYRAIGRSSTEYRFESTEPLGDAR